MGSSAVPPQRPRRPVRRRRARRLPPRPRPRRPHREAACRRRTRCILLWAGLPAGMDVPRRRPRRLCFRLPVRTERRPIFASFSKKKQTKNKLIKKKLNKNKNKDINFFLRGGIAMGEEQTYKVCGSMDEVSHDALRRMGSFLSHELALPVDVAFYFCLFYFQFFFFFFFFFPL